MTAIKLNGNVGSWPTLWNGVGTRSRFTSAMAVLPLGTSRHLTRRERGTKKGKTRNFDTLQDAQKWVIGQFESRQSYAEFIRELSGPQTPEEIEHSRQQSELAQARYMDEKTDLEKRYPVTMYAKEHVLDGRMGC